MEGQLTKRNSTKGERRISEILKRNKIKYVFKARIGKYEVDFLIGKMVLEVDGVVHRHANTKKDVYLVSRGYTPVHLSTYFKNALKIEQEFLSFIRANNPNKQFHG